MADLGYDYDTIRKIIAVELGFSRTSTDWTTAESEDIDDVVRHGLSLYYNPPIEPYVRGRHQWSFLSPYMTINAVAGQEEYTLAAGFCGIAATEMSVRQNSVPDRVVQFYSEDMYRQIRSGLNYVEGYPVAAAIYPVSSDGTAQQTFKLAVWPTPSAGQTFVFAYYPAQSMLDSTHKYPLGMPQYADVFRAACLAAAELKLDDEQGKHWKIYTERVAAAVAADRRNLKGSTFGVMRDTDDNCDDDDDKWHSGTIDFTVRTI